MKEIKFRAWNKDIEKMGVVIILNIRDKSTNIQRGENLYGYDFGEIELMQYTGLKDKNGKEIYEEDIVKRFGEVGTIEWDEVEARFRLYMRDMNPMPRNYPVSNVLDLEVVGNIYENPELLK